MEGLENYSKETTENFQKNYSENSDSQRWFPNSGKLSEIKAQGDAEVEQSAQEADNLLQSLDLQQPNERKVSVSTLTPNEKKEYEERKKMLLDDFNSYLKEIINDENDDDLKNYYINRASRLFLSPDSNDNISCKIEHNSIVSDSNYSIKHFLTILKLRRLTVEDAFKNADIEWSDTVTVEDNDWGRHYNAHIQHITFNKPFKK